MLGYSGALENAGPAQVSERERESGVAKLGTDRGDELGFADAVANEEVGWLAEVLGEKKLEAMVMGDKLRQQGEEEEEDEGLPQHRFEHRRRRRREERERDQDMEDQQQQQSPKRARGSAHPAQCDLSATQSCARFLVSNAAAGSVIGKGGASIVDLQNQSGAKIHLSRSNEFFPGTSERIVVLTGLIVEVLAALSLILRKFHKEAEDDSLSDSRPGSLRLVVPNSVCGAIIGKGGGTIRSFIEESDASIKLSGMLQATSDRLVTITGNIEQQLKAADLILTKLLGDSNYQEYATTPLSYCSPLLIPANRGTRSLGMAPPAFPTGKGMLSPILPVRAPYPLLLPVPDACPVTVTLAVPDDCIGAIVGRGGKSLIEIQQASGATIKISDRGDYVTGTKDRKVTLVGSAEGVQVAQYYLRAKIQGASER